MSKSEIEISGYRPGAIGRGAELHAAFYSRHWDFGLYFEAKVARELADFQERFDPALDGFWCAYFEGRMVGSITIDGGEMGDGSAAHLRWFIMDEDCQGQGLGRRLMTEAMAFCDAVGFERVWLWTFAGLDAARRLYDEFGFSLCREITADQWGKAVEEQMFERLR